MRGVYVESGAAVGPDPSLAAVIDAASAAGVAVVALAPGAMGRVATTVAAQPVVAEVELRPASLADAVGSVGQGYVVVLVDVSDPGNAGTLLRSAEAFGAAAVVACDGCVDLFNPKVVRSSGGSLFRLPVAVDVSWVHVVDALGDAGVRRLGAVARDGADPAEADLSRCAIFLGAEAHGLPPDLEAVLDGVLTLPMPGPSESLNVGVAGSLLCYEASRTGTRRNGNAGSSPHTAGLPPTSPTGPSPRPEETP